jgi:hypothetical protein
MFLQLQKKNTEVGREGRISGRNNDTTERFYKLQLDWRTQLEILGKMRQESDLRKKCTDAPSSGKSKKYICG